MNVTRRNGGREPSQRRLRASLLGVILSVLLALGAIALSPATVLAQSPDDEYGLDLPPPGNDPDPAPEPAPDPKPEPTPAPEPTPEPTPAPAPEPAPEPAPAPEPTPEPVAAAPAAPVESSGPSDKKRDDAWRKERRKIGLALIPPKLDSPPPKTFSEPVDRSLSAIIADAVGQPAVTGLLAALALISAISAATALRRRRPASGQVA